MAERLFVTPNTVRTQIQALYGKLGATSRAEAVEAAIEIGLLEPLPVLAPGRDHQHLTMRRRARGRLNPRTAPGRRQHTRIGARWLTGRRPCGA